MAKKSYTKKNDLNSHNIMLIIAILSLVLSSVALTLSISGSFGNQAVTGKAWGWATSPYANQEVPRVGKISGAYYDGEPGYYLTNDQLNDPYCKSGSRSYVYVDDEGDETYFCLDQDTGDISPFDG